MPTLSGSPSLKTQPLTIKKEELIKGSQDLPVLQGWRKSLPKFWQGEATCL